MPSPAALAASRSPARRQHRQRLHTLWAPFRVFPRHQPTVSTARPGGRGKCRVRPGGKHQRRVKGLATRGPACSPACPAKAGRDAPFGQEGPVPPRCLLGLQSSSRTIRSTPLARSCYLAGALACENANPTAAAAAASGQVVCGQGHGRARSPLWVGLGGDPQQRGALRPGEPAAKALISLGLCLPSPTCPGLSCVHDRWRHESGPRATARQSRAGRDTGRGREAPGLGPRCLGDLGSPCCSLWASTLQAQDLLGGWQVRELLHAHLRLCARS